MPTSTYQLERGLTRRRAAELAQQKELRTVEFSSAVDDKVLDVLEREVFRKRKDVLLRARGLRAKTSLSCLGRVPSLENLAVESRAELRDVEAIVELGNLRQLQLSIGGLQSFGFLQDVSPDLRTLRIGRTRSKRPGVESIAALEKLHSLVIEGHRKGIEALSELTRLRQLSLSAVSFDDLSLLAPLQKLWRLRIGDCGELDLTALPKLRELRELELSTIKGLEDLSPLGRVRGLRSLHVHALPRVQRLPTCRSLAVLRSVSLESMKRLRSLKPLAGAPALEDLTVLEPRLEPGAFRCLRSHPTLRRLRVRTDGVRRGQQMERALGCAMERGAFRFERG